MTLKPLAVVSISRSEHQYGAAQGDALITEAELLVPAEEQPAEDGEETANTAETEKADTTKKK